MPCVCAAEREALLAIAPPTTLDPAIAKEPQAGGRRGAETGTFALWRPQAACALMLSSVLQCGKCGDVCYQVDRIHYNGHCFHPHCFQCDVCLRTLRPSNCICVHGKFYCIYHARTVMRKRNTVRRRALWFRTRMEQLFEEQGIQHPIEDLDSELLSSSDDSSD
jgi:hypothetical protein